jgi:hypothetical protein
MNQDFYFDYFDLIWTLWENFFEPGTFSRFNSDFFTTLKRRLTLKRRITFEQIIPISIQNNSDFYLTRVLLGLEYDLSLTLVNHRSIFSSLPKKPLPAYTNIQYLQCNDKPNHNNSMCGVSSTTASHILSGLTKSLIVGQHVKTG